MNDLNYLDGLVQYHAMSTVIEMLLYAYTQLSSLQAKQATNNSSPSQVSPLVLLTQIYALRLRQLFEITLAQANCFKKTSCADHIVTLEDRFFSFKQYVTGSPLA